MAIALSAWIDRSNVRPGVPERAHLVVELVASGEPREKRPATSTVLAIDVSGSMQGVPLQQVVKSVDKLLDGFREDDRIGVVAFSDSASSIVDLVSVDAAGKRLVRSRVARLVTQANTNIEAGLELSATMLTGEERGGVVLLSDGVPNRGACLTEDLREVVKKHRSRVSFSSLGYGANHSEDVLAGVAASGGGSYAFVADPAVCARAFARAVGAQADVVASGIELVIGLGEGVELLSFVGREDSKVSRDGIVVALGDMTPEARRVVVCEVMLTGAHDKFAMDVASLDLRWKEGKESHPVSIEIGNREPSLVAEALERAMLAHADVAREQARGLADGRNFAGAAAVIRKMMARMAEVPGFVQGAPTPLGDAYEALVDEAAAMERNPDAEMYAAYRKGTVGERLAAPSSRAVGESTRMMEVTAGPLPLAWVVHRGVKITLKHECTIGRSSACDVPVASNGVSRRHADIYAMEGTFYVQDLGSTNTTMLNGHRISSKPSPLKHGDIITVGDVDLRFEDH